MEIGLLWRGDNADFTENIRAGGNHYKDKYGVTPNVCHVNKKQLASVTSASKLTIDGMRVVASEMIRRNHFWIGRE